MPHSKEQVVMIELYASGSPNVVKVYIALEELGLAYHETFIDVWKGEQFSPELTRVNPNQKIPAIVDQEGPDSSPYAVFESGAILLYLAEKTGKLLPTKMTERFDVLQWLFLQHGGQGPMSGQLVHFTRYAPKDLDPYSHKRYLSEVNRLYDIYDARLAKVPFIGGQSYSIADIAAFPWMRGVSALGVEFDRRTHVKAWYDKIKQRDAVVRAFAKVAAIKSSMSIASDDDKDRFFRRGKFAHG
jgi:GST-like protein